MKQNNKILIKEIFHQQKLITGSLLLEGLSTLVDDVINYAAKLVGKVSDDVERLVVRLSKASTEEEIMSILSNIARSSDEMADMIIPRVMSTISDVERKTINDIKKLFKDSIENGQIDETFAKSSAEDWVDKNVKTQFDGVKDLIKKEITDYIDDVAKRINSPKPKPKPSINPSPKPEVKTITDVAGQNWEDIKPLIPEELKNLEKLYRQKGLGKSFFKAMRAFGQSVIDMLTKQYKLMDETLSLIKTLDETTNAAEKVDIAKRIGDNVKYLTQKDVENYKIIDEWIETNVLDWKLKSKLKNIPGYQKAANIFDNGTLLEWKKTYKGFWERRGELLKQLNSMMNPASWFGQAIKKWPGDSYGYKVYNKWKSFIKGPEFGELRRYILTGQTQKWSGFKKFKEDFGFVPAIGNVAKEWAYSYVVLAVILGVVDYVTDVLGNQLKNFKSLNEYGIIKSQIDSYNEHFKEESTKEGEGLGKSVGGFAFLIGDIAEYSFEELKDITIAFPGVIDNFFAFWYDLRNKPISEENAKKLLDQGNNLKKVATDDIEVVKEKKDNAVEKIDNAVEKVKEKTQEISIVNDIKPAAPCLFTGGWTVDLTEKDGYVTHNSDWTQKHYIDVTKKDGVTTVYYKNSTTKPCN